MKVVFLSPQEMNAPSFRVEKNEDGSMHLHYYSDRRGLYHIVPGNTEYRSTGMHYTYGLIRYLQIYFSQVSESFSQMKTGQEIQTW